MKRKQKWFVRIGEQEWRRHTYERDADDDIRLLGSICRGAQIGALGITSKGDFIQVVGDQIVPLNRSQISRLVPANTLREKNAAKPVVIVKRRKILVPV